MRPRNSWCLYGGGSAASSGELYTSATGFYAIASHLVWLRVVMAGILFLSASANNDDYPKSPCESPCKWPQDCNHETGLCECRNSACNRVVFNGLSWICQEDVECAQYAAFSHCVRNTCLCLPGYMATSKNKCELTSVTVEETTTYRSWRPPPTPHGPGPADYSGVVKLALGAAIVMLAGVILALVWNLYRERRRAAQGLSRPPANRRRRQQAQRNSGLPHSHDLPPSYNDIFIISGAEAGRRHEKPPSYEEAMRDPEFAVVAPLAFVNYGFTGEGGPMAPSRRGPVRHTDTASVPLALVPSPDPSNTSWQPSLNVTSIMNRLGSTPTRLPRSVSDCGPGRSTVPTILLTECESVDDNNSYPPTNYDGLNVRRTKSGRAPHRCSTSDLTRSESMGSVAESCCSTSNAGGEVSVTAPSDSSRSKQPCGKSLEEYVNLDSPVLARTVGSEDHTCQAAAPAPSVDNCCASATEDSDIYTLTTNQYCENDGKDVVIHSRSSSPVSLRKDIKTKCASDRSDACDATSTKVPDISNASSITVPRQIDISFPMNEEDAHSNADVSFC